MREQRYTLKLTGVKFWLFFALIASFACFFTILKPSKASAATLGYPYSQMPCEHYPYYVSGACANFDWGPVHTELFDDPSEISSRGYAYRNCTDYVAWKEISLGANVPYNLGNAADWYGNVPISQRATTPKAWDAAVMPGRLGHVAFIETVNSLDATNPLNSNITVSEYNYYGYGEGDTRMGSAASLGFTGFIDFGVHPAPIITASQVVGRADFNHDGISDFVIYSAGLWSVKSGAGNNPFIIQNLSFGGPNDKPLLGDFNRDGTTDFVIYSGGQWSVKSGSSPFGYLAKNVFLGRASDIPLLGDFNGDRVPDFTIFSKGQWAVKSGSGTNAYVAQGVILGKAKDVPLVSDYNNDGVDDFVINSGGQWAVRSGKNGYSYVTQGLKLGDGGCDSFATDFNNDGWADFIVSCNGQWAVKSGTAGHAFILQGVILGKTSDVPMLGDFNGDGIEDFVIDSGGQWAVKSGLKTYNYIKQGVMLGNKYDIPLSG